MEDPLGVGVGGGGRGGKGEGVEREQGVGRQAMAIKRRKESVARQRCNPTLSSTSRSTTAEQSVHCKPFSATAVLTQPAIGF